MIFAVPVAAGVVRGAQQQPVAMRLKAVGRFRALVTEQAVVTPASCKTCACWLAEKACGKYADQPRLQQCQIPDDPVEAVIQGQGCPLYLVAL